MDTFPGTVLGYRVWNTKRVSRKQGDEFFLCPAVIGNVIWRRASMASFLHWNKGVNKATCMVIRSHRPPEPHCVCGLYAFHKLWKAVWKMRGRREQIIGAVAGSGDVQVHATGFRAEEAQIIALLRNKRNPHCRQLAEAYGVPLFDNARQLRRFALQKSRPAPEDARPALRWYENTDILWMLLTVCVMVSCSCILLQPLALIIGSTLLAEISILLTLSSLPAVCAVLALMIRLNP